MHTTDIITLAQQVTDAEWEHDTATGRIPSWVSRPMTPEERASGVNFAAIDASEEGAVGAIMDVLMAVRHAYHDWFEAQDHSASSIAFMQVRGLLVQPGLLEKIAAAIDAVHRNLEIVAAEGWATEAAGGDDPAIISTRDIFLDGMRLDADAWVIINAAVSTLTTYAVTGLSITDATLGDVKANYVRPAVTAAHRRARHAAIAERMGVTAFLADEPVDIVASEILDKNTCGKCAEIDGTHYGTLEAALSDYPRGIYRRCEAGPRCRGTLVITWGTPRTEPVPVRTIVTERLAAIEGRLASEMLPGLGDPAWDPAPDGWSVRRGDPSIRVRRAGVRLFDVEWHGHPMQLIWARVAELPGVGVLPPGYNVPVGFAALSEGTYAYFYDPTQPRDPRGVPTGGRWTSAGRITFGPTAPAFGGSGYQRPTEAEFRHGRALVYDWAANEDTKNTPNQTKDANAKMVAERMVTLAGERVDPSKSFGDLTGMPMYDRQALFDAVRYITTERDATTPNPDGTLAPYRSMDDRTIMPKSEEEWRALVDNFRKTATTRGEEALKIIDKHTYDELMRFYAMDLVSVNVGARVPNDANLNDAELVDALQKTSLSTYPKLVTPYLADAYRQRFLSDKLSPEEAYIAADTLTHAWAISSHSELSVLVHESVSRLFDVAPDGLDDYLDTPRDQMARNAMATAWTSTNLNKSTSDDIGMRIPVLPTERLVDLYTLATYQLTQEWLKEQGIKGITLYRGFTGFLDQSDVTSLTDGRTMLSSSPLTAWATDLRTAQNFGNSGAQPDVSAPGTVSAQMVLQQNVPNERIFSTSRTGPGCVNEFEALVIAAGRTPSLVNKARIDARQIRLDDENFGGGSRYVRPSLTMWRDTDGTYAYYDNTEKYIGLGDREPGPALKVDKADVVKVLSGDLYREQQAAEQARIDKYNADYVAKKELVAKKDEAMKQMQDAMQPKVEPHKGDGPDLTTEAGLLDFLLKKGTEEELAKMPPKLKPKKPVGPDQVGSKEWVKKQAKK